MTKMMKMFSSSHALAASVLIAAFPIVGCIEDSEPVEADPVSDQDMLGSTDTTDDAVSPVDGTLSMEPQSSGPIAIATPHVQADNCYYPSECDSDWGGLCGDYCKEHGGFSHMSSDGCWWPQKKCCCMQP